MKNDVISRIRRLQSDLPLLKDLAPAPHKPEMLLIGCVDARLNPKIDIGIPDGKALIHRNIAALVRSKPNPADNEGSSVAASLEFAINVMKVKHIVVMGHTDCGGIMACLHGAHDDHMQHIRRYLAPLDKAREEVLAQGGDIEAQALAMEEAAIRQSIANLKTYDLVQSALKEKRVELHGWLINTATKRIAEMDLSTGKFNPMHQSSTT